MDVGTEEEVTREERQENRDFIDACIDTKLMKHAHKYLASKGAVPHDELGFKKKLYNIWFSMFRRGTRYVFQLIQISN